MEPVPLPAPFAGVNERLPTIALQSPNCADSLNFNPEQEGMVLRYGDSKFSTFTLAGTSDPMGLYAYGNTKLFTACYKAFGGGIAFIDAETGAVAYTTGNQLSITAVSSMLFNNYLFFFFNTSTFAPGYVWDGAAMGASGYTGTNLWPIGGAVFNHRAYMIQLNEAAYWYSPIDAISGACTKVDLTTVISEKATLSIIASFTLSDQVTTQRVQTFIFSTGEVLFYSGSYPNGPDWTNIGSAKIGQPLFIQSVIPYQGDTLVMCDAGVVSLRDLFLKGSQQAMGLSVNDNSNKTWQALVKDIRRILNTPTGPITGGYLVGNIRGVYDPKTDRIIISFPYYLSSGVATTGSYYFVFNNQLKSWVFHQSGGGTVLGTFTVYDMVSYKNKVITLGKSSNSTTYMHWSKEGSTGFTDRDETDSSDRTYNYVLESAPISNGRAYIQKAEGMDVIVESDLYAQTNYKFIRDFGVGETTAQLIASQPTGVQKPFVNMGIEGSFIQYKIYGTTTSGKTVGYKLYGTNIWISQGNSPR